METVKKNSEAKMKKAIVALTEELNGIRTGRASSALFEKIKVDYYGQKVTLKEVASISVPEARLVVIQPWDRTVLPEIEKAIQKSELSINPNNDGKVIRISIPPLTEERRKELVKTVKKIAEQSRVSVRNVRRDANEELKKMAKDSKISEDNSKRGQDDIQKITDKYIEEINKLSEEKEKEILEV
ncbi:MAG: ribosome recycling factor [Spirochaetales bacterium]|nr:ribosome recycling factor [Spirochaetales bacterium]